MGEDAAEKDVVPPRPWPDAERPTKQQWLDWFLTCPRAEQERLIGNLMDQSDQAWRCFVQRHEDELHLLRQRVARLLPPVTPMDRLAVEQGRRTEAERRLCSQVGCPGDGRYQPPGRGHLPDCSHEAVTWTWEQVIHPGQANPQ